MVKWKKTFRRLFEELVCSSTRGVNLFRWIPLQRGIFSNYQIELLCHRGRVSFRHCWNNIWWRKAEDQDIPVFSPLRQKSAEVFLLEWPLSYRNAPPGVLRCTQVCEHGHKKICQDVRKHKSTVTRGYARSMSGLFRHFPLSRSPLFLPHPNPNFLNPFNWGGHLIETGMWQLCQPCFKCKQSESRHLHTGEGHWDIWHIIHSPPSLVFWWVYPVFFFPAPADNISLHDVHLSNAAFCGFRSPAVVFIEPTPPLSSDHNYFQ